MIMHEHAFALFAIPDVVEPECNATVVLLCSIAQPRAIKY